MTNRRQFLQTAAALSAVPLAGRADFTSPGNPPAYAAIIYDTRHAEAREFGARAGPLRAALRGIEGDITDLWQNELRSLWTKSPTAIAGLTERPALFLLEQLSLAHGLRVVYEAEHQPVQDGSAIHKVIRNADPGLAPLLDASGRSWPGVLADAMVTGHLAPVRNFYPTDAALFAHLGEAPKLYSWIIAPRSAV